MGGIDGMNTFPEKRYRTIYVDPPWMETGGGKIKRGADKHYDLMKTKDIILLPVKEIADTNCHLYLWTTNNFLPAALAVMEAWGFKYKTTITWAKDRFGLGQYFRGQTEHCLFGVRGTLPYKTEGGKRQQGRTLLVAPRKEHSVKPEQMRTMIEKVSYPPYIELFARRRADGWDAWGNEIQTCGDIRLRPVER
jgi:N6-adenosine-specific RNA methylase IME4